jgi:hypothetical protein
MRSAGDPSGGTANLCGNTVQAIVRYEKKDGQVRSLLALLVQKYEYRHLRYEKEDGQVRRLLVQKYEY